MNLRYKLMRFMNGRYGIDTVFYMLFGVAAILFVVNFFARTIFVQLLIDVVMIYAFFRVLSRNLDARRRENQMVLGAVYKFKKYWNTKKQRANDKTHVYKKCPSCHSVLRLPRRKGKHTTVCPRCKKEFKVYVFKA